ncbi:MAG: 2,3-diphosphoglycerate-dependent phosphoglycerate mutase [Candidatus Azambacteria bacterium]|nr:2,3-diphosphoglycerate-dependent phosphoglycerate mutase [Candidatus Azambacteria bacterium]
MAKLFLVRHGKSEWNKKGLWTGWTDVGLADEGHEEAKKAGEVLKGESIHAVYTSELKRTHQTFEGIREAMGAFHLERISHHALNERRYGIHTGKNKWQVKEEVGEEVFHKIRRGWDVAIPEGETLKDVHARVVPYYEENIKKDLKEGKNVLVVAHGNSLRALMKHLENLDEVRVCEVEVGTGEIHCYHLDEFGTVLHKEIKNSSQ